MPYHIGQIKKLYQRWMNERNGERVTLASEQRFGQWFINYHSEGRKSPWDLLIYNSENHAKVLELVCKDPTFCYEAEQQPPT